MNREPNSLSLGPDRPGSGGWRTGRRASSLKQPLNSSLMGLSFAAGMVQNLSLNPQGSHPPYMQRSGGNQAVPHDERRGREMPTKTQTRVCAECERRSGRNKPPRFQMNIPVLGGWVWLCNDHDIWWGPRPRSKKDGSSRAVSVIAIHDELVEALRDIVAAYEDRSDQRFPGHTLETAMPRAIAALARAEGEGD